MTTGEQLDSQEKSLNKGKAEVLALVDRLAIRPRDDTAEAALRLFGLALQRSFTSGRRTAQVCLSADRPLATHLPATTRVRGNADLKGLSSPRMPGNWRIT